MARRNPLSLSDQFAHLMQAAGLPPFQREYRFHKTTDALQPKLRLRRFDFAWPEVKVAAEVDGGVFINGRHNRGLGYIADCIKLNTATQLGWSVFRYPSNLILPGTAVMQLGIVLRDRGL